MSISGTLVPYGNPWLTWDVFFSLPHVIFSHADTLSAAYPAFTSQDAPFRELTWVLAEEEGQLQFSFWDFHFPGTHRMSWAKVSAAETDGGWTPDPRRSTLVEAWMGGGDFDTLHWTLPSGSNNGLYFLCKVIPKSFLGYPIFNLQAKILLS